MSMNLVVLTGRLTRDPELKHGQSGMAYCKFTIAVNRMRRDDPADFIGCSAFGKTAELINEYLHKGSHTGIQGRIQTSNYEVNGEKRYRTEVIVDRIEFLESKNSSTNTFEPKLQSETNSNKTTEAQKTNTNEEDEFPF